MRFCRPKPTFSSSIAGICGLIWLLMGCTTLGPQYIASGRAAYNKVINHTEDQQMLMAIVRNRYGETISMLAVTNVTANIRFTASAEAQFGLGRRESYETNLIPLSTGLAFEDNPTISYAPIEGEEQFDRLMSPVPLKFVVILSSSMEHSRLPFLMLIKSINHIRNPKFLHSPMSETDPRFMHIVDLISTLTETGHIDWARDSREEVLFSIVIRNYEPRRTEEIHKLLDLLGVKQKVDGTKSLVVPVYDVIEEPATGGVAVTTNSIYDLIEMLSASIDVPDKHRQSGLAINYPPPGLAGSKVRIERSNATPQGASVSISYRSSYFYIAETDQDTKLMFRILRTLWKDRIASTTQFQSAPVLTIPVGN
jgi:hypothetical protein